MRGDDLWVYVCESSLRDRLDFMQRLKERPMQYATEDEKRAHQAQIYATQREIREICADLEKARGEI